VTVHAVKGGGSTCLSAIQWVSIIEVPQQNSPGLETYGSAVFPPLFLVPGRKCSEVAKALNEIYASYDLLQYRTFGYGHSFGVLCHYYGREAGLELREDCNTVLQPGMVVSMEPMIMVPEGRPGAGGYREHDILVITENGNRNITGFPYGPEHLIVKQRHRKTARRAKEKPKTR
jgi:hypothetical protein